jgi:hypothetical protein
MKKYELQKACRRMRPQTLNSGGGILQAPVPWQIVGILLIFGMDGSAARGSRLIPFRIGFGHHVIKI